MFLLLMWTEKVVIEPQLYLQHARQRKNTARVKEFDDTYIYSNFYAVLLDT
jgi:hypothetical protein